MNKFSVILILSLLIIPLANAAISIQKPEGIPVVIAGSDDPVARYMMTLTNPGLSDDVDIYSLVGVKLTPETVRLETNQPTAVLLEARPNAHILANTRGYVKFQYEIYSSSTSVTKDELLFRLVDMKDVFFFRPTSIQPGDTTFTVGIQNLEDATFENVRFVISSDLVNGEKTVTLAPHQTLTITLPIDQEILKRETAGTYPLTIDTYYQGAKGHQVTDLKYLEKGGIAVQESSKGFIIHHTIKEKTNEGNVPISVTITDRNNILTRLLTTHDPRPTSSLKRGFFVTYTWQEELQPAQTLRVESTTNYTLPVIILALIILGIIIVKWYTAKTLSLVKRVSYVKTRGGEFALKVTIHARAHGTLKNITITDRIPHAMKLYESFGIKPDSVDEATRRLTWKMSHLNAGESRVFSYIMYSKIRVVGSFELPLAHASYTEDNKAGSVFSNKTVFSAEISSPREH